MSTAPKNDHGWMPVGLTLGGGSLSIAPLVTARTCGCQKVECYRPATQEDFLCDECRDTCGGTS